mgnify:FL=1
MNYDYSTSYTSADLAIAGITGGLMVVYGILGCVIGVLGIIAMWKIFTKAGKPGWAAIIPVYNMVVLYQIVGLNPLLLLILIGSIIPFVNFLVAIAFFVLNIISSIKLSKVFGKGTGFAVGLIFLPFIFQLILAFDKSEYVGVEAAK